MAEKFISPKGIYEDPSKFAGIIKTGAKNGHPEYPVIIFNLMKKLYPEFKEKLGFSMKGYVTIGKDGKPYVFITKDGKNDVYVEPFEVPSEIYDQIKEYLT